MGPNDRVISLACALRGASGFEQAARMTAEAVLGLCDDAMRASKIVNARLSRALLHVRPGGSYSRIASHGPPGQAGKSTPVLADVAPSASVYRWVEGEGRPVLIDMLINMVSAFDGAQFNAVHMGESGPFDSLASQKSLVGREVTHVLAIPLRAPAGGMIGMLSVEATARGAVGKPLVWTDVASTAGVMLDLASPYLLALPAVARRPPASDPLLPVIGPTMQDVVEMLSVFAQQDETILLSGPTGAGKSRLARWCHAQSGRAESPFVVLDLSAFPDNLREAELFGWRKGAFTGAVGDSLGAVGRAEGGTLFIDEIDKLSLEVQAALLRLLEERTYRVLGDSSGDRTANVRFLIGTNADLPALVRAQRFREDLYYRIHVLPVRVPSLAERKEEIGEWASFMLARRHGTPQGLPPILSDGARRALELAPWPGNLRQLDNIVRRAYAMFLVERRAGTGPVIVEARHVERALAYEGARPTASFVEILHAAATAFVLEAEQRGAPLDVDLTLAIKGLVLGAAVQKLGNPEDAFKLLGGANLVQHRNHLKVLRRELKRVADLYTALNAGPSPFEGLVDDGDS